MPPRESHHPRAARLPEGGILPLALLVGANLVPLAGVFAWDWKVFDIVALYWMENVIVGVFNVAKMLICAPDPARIRLPETRAGGSADAAGSGAAPALVHHLSKLFFIPFFTVHYGLFTLVHGIFVFALLGGKESLEVADPVAGLRGMIGEVLGGGGKWAALALAISHGVSFGQHFLIGGEYRRTAAPIQMFAPYGRVVVLHVAILLGAFAAQALGSPLPLLAILIGGKIAVDLALHRRSHRPRPDGGAGGPGSPL